MLPSHEVALSKLKLYHWQSLLSLCLLIVLYCITALLSDYFTPTSLLVKLLPLLAFIPFYLKQTPMARIWLCFVILLYFIGNVLVIMGVQPTGWDIAKSFVIIWCFVSAMLHKRYQKIDTYYQTA